MPAEIPADVNVSSDNRGFSNAATDLNRDYDRESLIDTDTEYNMADALLYTHPDYVDNLPKWIKFSDLYESDDIYKYIYQHPRETEIIFHQRLIRAFQLNYCAGVVDLFVAYMFASDIVRDTKGSSGFSETLVDIYKNADLQGTSYEMFMHQVAIYSLVYGHMGVLVDAPRMGEDIVSERDRKTDGIRPFLNLVSPQQIRDWSRDRFGRFNWVKIEVPVEENREFNNPVNTRERRFLIWDREGWQLWSVTQSPGTGGDDARGDVDAKLVGAGDSPDNIKGEVPLVIFQNSKRLKHDWFGNSAIRDISDINIALMNWASLADEEIHNRCLNILAMERDNSGDIATNLSHHNVLEYSTGTNPPQYLTPGDTPLNLIGDWIDRAKDEIYRLAKLGGSTGMASVSEATSGIAYAYEFNETNQSLAEKAASMEAGENKVHSLLARWFGKEFDGNIEYPRDFGVDDFLLELDLLIKGRESLTSQTAIRELEKRVISKLYSRKPLEFRKKIEKEIEDADAIPAMVGAFDAAPAIWQVNSEQKEIPINKAPTGAFGDPAAKVPGGGEPQVPGAKEEPPEKPKPKEK